MKSWVCTIAGGTLELGDREAFGAYLKRLKPGTYLLGLSRPGEVRSPQANGWYWAGLREVAEEAGYDDPEELHEVFKAKFLAFRDDRGRLRIGSTAKLTTGEFLAYLEKVNRLCFEMFGFYFPMPETQGR